MFMNYFVIQSVLLTLKYKCVCVLKDNKEDRESNHYLLSLSFTTKITAYSLPDCPGPVTDFWGLVRDQRYSEGAWSSDFEPRDIKAHSSGKEQRVCERLRGAGDQHHPDQEHHHITRST